MSENKTHFNSANIAILGASGYTGIEAIRLLVNNSNYNIVNLTADSNAGMSVSEVYPHLSRINLPDFKKIEDINFSKVSSIRKRHSHEENLWSTFFTSVNLTSELCIFSIIFSGTEVDTSASSVP